MTVSTATSRVDYTGNGVTTVFAVPFPFIEDSYLTVIRTVVATGAETALTLNSGGADGYTVSGAGQPVGSVTVVTAPTGAQRLSIIRAVPGTQEADFVANDPFPAETFEDSLDKLQMQINDNATRASRSPVLYDSDIDGSGRYNSNGNRYANAADGVSATDLATVQQITSAGSGSFIQAGAGSVIRTMQDKVREVASPEDFGAVGDGVADDTAAILAAVTAGDVRLTKGKTYRLTQRITVPDGRSIFGDRSAIISMDTGAGFFDNTNQALYDAADSLAFLFDGNTGGGLFGFRIRLANRTAELAAMAVMLRECDSVRVEGCEFDNFSKTKIIRVESSVDCAVDRNYFHDCEISSSTTGQLTGVDIDDVRPAGGSARISVCDNVFKDLTASAGFITSFGYQTDAINVSHEESDGHLICNNRIYTVGEGIDSFGANSVISDNLVQDAYAYGIKLVHGARRNVVEGNRIIDPGLGGIVLQGNTADVNHTEFNTVRCNHISGVNKAGNWTAATNFGIRCEDDGGSKFARNNIIRDNEITDGAAMKYGILSGNSSTGNQFRNNYVESFTIAEFDASGAASTYDFKSAKLAEVSAYQNVSQSASGSYQTVNYDTETLDRTGEYDPSTETYTATCPRKLLVTACWRTGGTTDLAVWDAQIRKNGSATRHTQTVARSSDLSVLISDVVDVVAGDTVTVAMRTSTGTPALTNAAEFTNLRITEVR